MLLGEDFGFKNSRGCKQFFEILRSFPSVTSDHQERWCHRWASRLIIHAETQGWYSTNKSAVLLTSWEHFLVARPLYCILFILGCFSLFWICAKVLNLTLCFLKPARKLVDVFFQLLQQTSKGTSDWSHVSQIVITMPSLQHGCLGKKEFFF